jgi:hypothetical protein
MYSKALVGYDKVVGLDHPRSRSLQDNLRALDAKGTLSESKRYKLLKKLVIYIFIIITLIERVLGELIFIYSGMLPPDVSSIF